MKISPNSAALRGKSFTESEMRFMNNNEVMLGRWEAHRPTGNS